MVLYDSLYQFVLVLFETTFAGRLKQVLRGPLNGGPFLFPVTYILISPFIYCNTSLLFVTIYFKPFLYLIRGYDDLLIDNGIL